MYSFSGKVPRQRVQSPLTALTRTICSSPVLQSQSLAFLSFSTSTLPPGATRPPPPPPPPRRTRPPAAAAEYSSGNTSSSNNSINRWMAPPL